MKKVFIISTSIRKNSNSEYLAKEFMKGAQESGNQVDFVSLADKKLSFCKGCLACQNTHKCVISDDAIEIAEKLCKADVVLFATPIYYYEMSGQMKTLLDRCNSLFASDYAFRDIYLLATAADTDKSALDGAKQGLEGWISCFPKATLGGVLYGLGLTQAGDAAKHTALKEEAYTLGKSI